ncbi:FAD-binding oxidoreductase [Acidisoma cellulosilytica]|uniref:FAD-binding oxidoreductase n=1 Tax=Acidisoma cellulosilyticum TaxID=2802395 RepID=A0A963Z6M8_9PROT|nr:FAD-binding oxidoreductase [Acidisoma cellulosilyticum]MCB8883536.1 FAD-binding oxidoreductase [Acidisoma cellulosilyticum]
MFDVVIIGAGISGAATAYELSKAGHKVAVIDRYGPAAMASGWTLAGVRQSGRDPAELPLARAAVDIWGNLHEVLDAPTHYRRGGNLRLGRTEEELASLCAIVDEQSAKGLPIRFLDGLDAVRDVAPAVAPHITGASYCTTDGHADPTATVNAFLAAAERLGATMRFGEAVVAIEVEEGQVTGVRTTRDRIAAGQVVLAGGIFGNDLLNPLGLNVPLKVRLVSVVRTRPVAPILEQVIGVANAECAGRQEVTGRFRFTSGIDDWNGNIEDGDRPRVRPTTRDIAATIQLFGSLIPPAFDAEVEDIWGGLIDQTPDALPVIQRAGSPDGLVIAMGFSGHGFCLGPVTGKICAALVEGRDTGFDLAPFMIERFARRNDKTASLSLHG